MSRVLLAVLIGAAGLGLGITYGRLVSPVEYVDTDPASLRVDYRSDYVLMVAERFSADHDIGAALRRLAALGGANPERLCAEAIQFAQSTPYSHEDIELLQQLLGAVQAHALQGSPPSPSP